MAATLAVAAPAQAAPRRCADPPADAAQLSIRNVGAVEVRCSVARTVATHYANGTFRPSGRYTFNVGEKGRPLWRCRVTRRATGTDPGYEPETRVSCRSGARIVRFGLLS